MNTTVDIETPTDNYKLKKNLIIAEIEKMKSRKDTHYNLYKKYKFINTILKLNILQEKVKLLMMNYCKNLEKQ